MSFMFEDALTFLSNHLKSLDPTVEVNVYICGYVRLDWS